MGMIRGRPCLSKALTKISPSGYNPGQHCITGRKYFQTVFEATAMNLLRAVPLAMLCCSFIAACNTTSSINIARPAWIDNPGNGVSASAGMHVRGEVAQEELAILRAREEYAKRFGVKIEAAQTMTTTVAGGRSNTVGAQISHEESRHVDVKAEVKAKWRDPNSDVLWIWLVPSTQ